MKYMNNITKWLARALFACSMLNAQAELVVDTKFAGSTKNQDQMTWEEMTDSAFEKFIQTWSQRILLDIAASNEGIEPTSTPTSISRAHIIWNGVDYYAWAAQYTSAQQSKRKYDTLPGGGVCALLLYDKNLNPIASVKINLPENNHATFCKGTNALGGAGKGIDGLLLSVSYYLTDVKKNWWREQTLFLRLQKDAAGRVQLIQDDRCLGNPNMYKNIPIARKALAKCKDMNNGWIMIEDR